MGKKRGNPSVRVWLIYANKIHPRWYPYLKKNALPPLDISFGNLSTYQTLLRQQVLPPTEMPLPSSSRRQSSCSSQFNNKMVLYDNNLPIRQSSETEVSSVLLLVSDVNGPSYFLLTARESLFTGRKMAYPCINDQFLRNKTPYNLAAWTRYLFANNSVGQQLGGFLPQGQLGDSSAAWSCLRSPIYTVLW